MTDRQALVETQMQLQLQLQLQFRYRNREMHMMWQVRERRHVEMPCMSPSSLLSSSQQQQ